MGVTVNTPTGRCALARKLAPLSAVALLLGAVLAASAAAAPPKQLWQKCESGVAAGFGVAAGQCVVPVGVVSDPATGDVYVAESGTSRISEFDAWGQFVKAFGWGVRTGAAELQTCTEESTCRSGLTGGGPGEFSSPAGLAIDEEGDLYVVDLTNLRVEKFDPTAGLDGSEAKFLLSFGGDVNKTKVEAAAPASERNRCPVDPGDVCQAGTPGSDPGLFGGEGKESEWLSSSYIAAQPGQPRIYVGDRERVQVFDTSGNYLESVPVPGETVSALAVDPDGDLYVAHGVGRAAFEVSKPNITKLDPSGKVLCEIQANEPHAIADPHAIALDGAGNLYVTENYEIGIDNGRIREVTMRKWSPTCVEDPSYAFKVSGLISFDSSHGIAIGEGCGLAAGGQPDLYFASVSFSHSFLRAYGPHPNSEVCAPPQAPPTIEAQYAASVGATNAQLAAQINPHFWPDTTYYMQYGTEDCAASPSACEETKFFPGAHLNAEDDVGAETAGVFLTGLQPDTTYHYRFVAKSGGGGPVFGIGPAEADATFTTYPPALAPASNCPNQAFRTGASARLPDCRADEMVSPLDKEGGDVLPPIAPTPHVPASLEQSSVDGETMAYSSWRAFGGAQGGPAVVQYIASRGGTGWSTQAISPPQEGPGFLGASSILDSQFKAFSQDLCSAWLLQQTEPPLAPGALSGFSNLYLRHNCGASANAYEALTQRAPLETTPLSFVPQLQAFTEDGRVSVFRAPGKLTDDAAAPEVRQLYEVRDGTATLACILPSGTPSSGPCSAGMANSAYGYNEYRADSVHHALSADGSRLYWTDAQEGPGKIYLRVEGQETFEVSGVASSTSKAEFLGASLDGSEALFKLTEGPKAGNLYLYSAEAQTATLIAPKVVGVMGASEDESRVYFASGAVLGSEPNGRGELPQAGNPNLYLYDAGAETTTFIATLSPADVGNSSLGLLPLDVAPNRRDSRVSADGGTAAFVSTAPLTGSDNVDLQSGQADGETFLYDTRANALRCVSCNPSGARPRGALTTTRDGSALKVPIAGWIPGWTSQFYPGRPLAADGSRLYFNSVEPLVPRDTNGTTDVYEWEAAGSQARCEELGAELFLKAEGGCLSLISSGESPAESEFIDASASGRDLFFRTAASLVPQDPGLIDIYDAREGGGLPSPSGPAVGCEGEACQGTPSPPSDPSPASSSFVGAGNVSEAKAEARKCAKGKTRRKGRCEPKAKKKAHKKGRHTARRQRQGRRSGK
jgi:DNA-binding beta-propeller fold protein YncE